MRRHETKKQWARMCRKAARSNKRYEARRRVAPACIDVFFVNRPKRRQSEHSHTTQK